METNSIQNVAVLGAGSMGQQIAMLSALGGFTTYLQDINGESLSKAGQSLEARMDDWVKKEKISGEIKQAAFDKLHMTTDLKEAVQSADIVIEAVVEKLDVKQEVFAELDKLAPKEAILATNSSSIVNSKIAEVTERPKKVVNMHFFFPPLVMDCVEVVKSDQTSEETANAAVKFCEQLGRTAVLLEKEIYGFIANRLLFAISNEALYLYENGYADFEDIDIITKKALGHPLGPFELMDLSGIDVGYYANKQLYEETGDPKDKPAKSVEEKVKAGNLGRKTGKGWYEYSGNKKVKK
ncbi:3-hydroxyacyl-CoA dehydrogenase [Salimicrobium jeotgali]|uniref:3-hydroxyacyl-CoA dehydrogenase n=1 Tax=Salimicrobium jeotgali TaxID=1230341 RepID=K2FJY2_9BACI|nr:3-hydroxyacyl-CoA dehydrogenase family protein [Salimicrobium jeotgali]AKG05360.1 3-hydroxyacyl-CoA dehydrogenase [Salimicrobium jeotgali]EKE31366.1 3-hydroxyacyl-CoA dehydrogenase [Salimicrobium jeotgali]MBM7696976.1 3-hydroxybutyryl-CoA dehydrogenase [Salimicrobium jeotgali]